MGVFLDLRAIAVAVLALPVAASFAAASAQDAATGYSHILPLSVDTSQAVVQLRVPRDVYLHARSPSLNDLRVVDAGGASMPFALVDLVPPPVMNRSTMPLAVFPVYGPGRDAERIHDSLQIRTGTDGAVISVTAPARAASDELVSLVLDLRPAAAGAQAGLVPPVGALALTLPAGVANYSAGVALDVSDDLESWDELAEAAVSWLVNDQGASVQKHRIEFAPRSFRYARLRWLEGEPIAFSAIHAEYVVEKQAKRHVETLVLEGRRAAEGRDLVYMAPVAVPAHSLGLVFKGENIVMPVQLGQYQAVGARKAGVRLSPQLRSVVNATFYRMIQAGRHRASGDVEIPVTHASQWVMRPQVDVAEEPGLRLSWSPSSIVFVAGGKPPYRLAFGRAGVNAAHVALAQVAPGFSAHELAALKTAQPGRLIQQQSASTITDELAGSNAASSKRNWLWALLLGGVFALAAMAWHLFRQLKSGAPAPPRA